ncbi:adenylyltransferase/cytidyltransferase family protein [Arthrobacter cupressi]|uniref:Glycerol-3-phosphate cytidylyltransferase n=1 Tax=Arthrobacter cupressi TaxID=1045773 RepID=A0A1G8IX86_9MICC|nr:adenylyltransferase/cytidyltransferase family protein [Arthrobacter cupressi]NYD79157.1 glycerol-3-phosphate cytidylyltransferase [Arthrobacter cupressi]SDI23539.1 glycerol-3-phosphate cytidylyltransferase [Arthrobacter cupressi]
MSLRIGYAPGAFDLFHVGHLNILKHAKSRCDYLIAGVVSDEMLELVRGRAAVVPLAERIEIVRNIGYVDMAYAETVPDKLQVWEQLHFNLFFKGDDWKGTPEGMRLEEAFGKVGVEVVYFPYTVHTSSSALRAALELIGDQQDFRHTGSRP